MNDQNADTSNTDISDMPLSTHISNTYNHAKRTHAHTGKTHQKQDFSLVSSTEDVDKEDQAQRRRLRWWFCWVGLSLSILLFLAAIACTTIAFCITMNLTSLSIFATAAPPAYFINKFMGWIAEYVFPMDERTFQLKKQQAEAKAQALPPLKRIIG